MLDPVRMNSTSNCVVCAVLISTVDVIAVNCVVPQKHATWAFLAVALLAAVNVPKARTRHVELAAAVWLARVLPPVV